MRVSKTLSMRNGIERPKLLLTLQPVRLPAAELMAQRGTYLVPTTVTYQQ